MFQKNIDGLMTSIPNVFGIVENILIVGFDEWVKNHDEML